MLWFNLTPNGTYLPLKAFTIPIPHLSDRQRGPNGTSNREGWKSQNLWPCKNPKFFLSYKSGPGCLINSRSFSIDIKRFLEFFKSMSWSPVCGSFDLCHDWCKNSTQTEGMVENFMTLHTMTHIDWHFNHKQPTPNRTFLQTRWSKIFEGGGYCFWWVTCRNQSNSNWSSTESQNF